MKKFFFVLALFFTFLELVPVIQAQETEVSTPAVGEVSAPVVEMEKIVVTATKTEHIVGDVPISTTVITREELERQNVHNLAEAIRMIPGIYQYSSGAKIYGLGIEHTSLLIDGQKQYKCPGRMPILDRYPIEMIERIEIKKRSLRSSQWWRNIRRCDSCHYQVR